MVDLTGVELDLDDLAALEGKTCIRQRRARRGGDERSRTGREAKEEEGCGTYRIVDVGANDEALSPAGRVLDCDDVAGL